MQFLDAGASAVLHVNDFSIDYRSDGSVRQFFTDVSVVDTSKGVVTQHADQVMEVRLVVALPQPCHSRRAPSAGVRECG